jgi:hypothetical protein
MITSPPPPRTPGLRRARPNTGRTLVLRIPVSLRSQIRYFSASLFLSVAVQDNCNGPKQDDHSSRTFCRMTRKFFVSEILESLNKAPVDGRRRVLRKSTQWESGIDKERRNKSSFLSVGEDEIIAVCRCNCIFALVYMLIVILEHFMPGLESQEGCVKYAILKGL